MATHSSALAWRTPGMAEPGGLPSMGSHIIGHDWSDLAAAAAVASFLDLSDYFLSHVRELFTYNLFRYFLRFFLFFVFFWDPYNSNLVAFNVVPEITEAVLISFQSFFFILFCGRHFHHSVFQVTYLSFYWLFCYWGILVHFSFWLLSCSSLFGLQFVKVLIKLFVCSLDLCLHSFSRILLRSSLLSLLRSYLDHLYYRYSEFFIR